jgi:putative transposase
MTVDFSLPAAREIRSLDEVIEVRGKPQRILMDNGPAFTSNALDAWTYKNGIELHFFAQVNLQKMHLPNRLILACVKSV